MELFFKVFFGTERDTFSQRGTKVIRMCNCSQFFFCEEFSHLCILDKHEDTSPSPHDRNDFAPVHFWQFLFV